jgi:cobalt-zinc-cadmium efflux system membrane fusion protein
LNEAKAAYRSLAEPLAVMGAQVGGGGGYPLIAPISGVITQRAATPGRYVDPQETLFEIVDASRVWAELSISESDMGFVRTGLTATVTLDALGERKFQGTIMSIAPALDPQTRTAKAHVSLANPDGALRANMYGRARISVGSQRASVVVPRDAVQQVKDIKLAFVKLSEDEFARRSSSREASSSRRKP